jgi:hypothetical protein
MDALAPTPAQRLQAASRSSAVQPFLLPVGAAANTRVRHTS